MGIRSGGGDRSPADERVARAQAGDTKALEALLEEHYDLIRRFLFRLVGPCTDLDDLQQTVLLRVVDSLKRFRGEAKLSTWIGGICVHVARDHLRSKKVRAIMHSMADVEASAPRGRAGVHEQIEARRKLSDLKACLAGLSTNARTAFVLRTLEGYSVDEIATMMGSAKSTTRMRLYYARKAVAKALEELGYRDVLAPAKDAP